MTARITRLLLLFSGLLLSLSLAAQYPSNPIKSRLGYQTTGDGLVFRGAGAPAYSPGTLFNAWTYLDTTNMILYGYKNFSWVRLPSANNGLTMSGAYAQLGGSLIQNTTVESGTYNLKLGKTSGTNYAYINTYGSGEYAGMYSVYGAIETDFGIGGGAFNLTSNYADDTNQFSFTPTGFDFSYIGGSGVSRFRMDSTKFNMVGLDSYASHAAANAAELTNNLYMLNDSRHIYINSGTGSADILGTGTTNRVPLWTTTNTLGSSNIQDNNTAVSILNSKPFQLGQWTTAGRPTGTAGYEGYNTTGNGKEWYDGTRWNYIPKADRSAFTSTYIPFTNSSGQLTESSLLTFNSSNGVFTASSVQNSNGNPVLGCDGSNFAMGRNFDYRIVMTGNYQQFQSPTSPGVSVTNMRLQNQSAYIGGAVTPAASSVLELGSTTKGFLPPRQTAAQRTAISSPSTGLQVFQTDATEGYYSKYAAGWKRHLVEGDATWLKTELEAGRDVDITGTSSTDFRLRSNTRIQFDGKMKFGADSATIIDPSINRIYTKDTIYAEYGIVQTNVNPRVGKNINTSVLEQGSIFFGDGIRRFVDGWSAGPNIAFGRGLLNNAGTGGRFVAIGDVVLDGALTGYNAVGIGIEVADFAPASGDNYFIGGVTVARYATNLNRSVIIASNSFNRTAGINLSQTVAFGATLGNTMTSRNVGGTQLGYQQLQSLVSGDQVSSYGYQAGKVIKRGTNLSFVGNYTGATDTMFSDASAIGNYAAIGQNQSITIGAINGVNSATYDAKIGIGTTTPAEKLHIVGAVKIEGMVTVIQESYNNITSTTSPVTLSSTISDNLINQGSTQATFTLKMPASPVDGQVLYITYNNAITTLTIDGNGNTIVGSAVTTAVAGSQRKFKFYSGIGWIKQY